MNTTKKTEQTLKFKKIFEQQRASLLLASRKMAEELAVKTETCSDEIDLTSAELEQNLKMRLHARESLFIKKIDESLFKIQSGTFGVCEECLEDIEFLRLEVRPTATLCICCKENEEAKEYRSADGLRIA